MAIINDKSKITPFVVGVIATLAVTGWGTVLLTQDAPSIDIPDPQIVDNTNNTQTNNTNVTTPTNNTTPTNQTNNPPVNTILPQVNITGATFQQLINPHLNPYTLIGYRQCYVNTSFTSTYGKPVDIVYSIVPEEGFENLVRIEPMAQTAVFWFHDASDVNKDALKINFTQTALIKLYIYFVDTETHKYASGVYEVGLVYDGRNINYTPIKLHTNLESLVGQVAF